jgi:hypothetical protein
MLEGTSKTIQELKASLLQAINTVFRFLNSAEFSLRLVELLSIVVIQRNNNVFSFVSLLWLAFVSTVNRQQWVLVATGLVMLPFELSNFIITYFYNIPNSPAQNVTDGTIWGLAYSPQMWLDVLIFNAFFHYIILYLKEYRRLKDVNYRNSNPFVGKPTTW